MAEVRLRKGKEKAVFQKHPWIFSGALEKISGDPANGEVVTVRSATQEFLGYGHFNDQSRVAVRMLSWKEEEPVNGDWYQTKIRKALSARKHLLEQSETNTYRLIFSEADFLPGLIVDQYAGFLSLQLLSTGMEKAKEIIIQILNEELQPKGIFDRTSATALQHEGMVSENGLLWGEAPPPFLEVRENDLLYHINIAEGQKSGFYCDQRENRRLFASYVQDKHVLDCFCYSGGFSLNALRQGAAYVTSVDSSALAVATLKENMRLNHFEESRYEAIQSDVNKQLRLFREEGRFFDAIVLDPPKYAPTRSSLDRAAKAYKDLNRLGLLLLKEGGLLATFSCSGAVDIETFKQIIAWAALDAGKEVQIVHQFCQPEDHPVRLAFPEGEYLKGLLLRVV